MTTGDDALARTGLAWRRTAVTALLGVALAVHGALHGNPALVVPAVFLTVLAVQCVVVDARRLPARTAPCALLSVATLTVLSAATAVGGILGWLPA